MRSNDFTQHITPNLLTGAAPRRFRHRLTLLILLAFLGSGFVFAQPTGITSLGSIGSSGDYLITADIDALGFESPIASFSGTLQADIDPETNMPYRIKNLGVPLFTTLTGTVKNLVLEDVDISGNAGNTGAIAGTANSTARIFNVGILSGSVGGTGYTGGLVGQIDGNARVVNCYSYATITAGTDVGGIVGYNTVATTASTVTTGTMVMNCMFYGDITGGSKRSPVYGGNNINNLNSGGLNTFNYYAYDEATSFKAFAEGDNKKYNCALAVEGKYLNRIEFYRLLLNSNKKLAAYYASTTTVTVNPDDIAKWVLETADRQITDPKPYPVLKPQGKYPSIINIDADNADQLTLVNGRPEEADRNKGGKIGTLSVTISAPSGWTNAPNDAKLLDAGGNEITTSRTITLNRTDKDEARFNFNYDKVQLPYYNDYGTKNYTGNKVVTGWKITDISTVSGDPYVKANYPSTGIKDYPDHNYADRKSSNKDKYSISGRIFSQGAYFDVPYGVTSITIEPYWGNAAYLADEYIDVVSKVGSVSGRNSYITQSVTQLPKSVSDNKITINGSEQTVYTTIANALGSLSGGSTVYDKAVVLVGNFHQIGVPSNGSTAFTLMSVDLDKDNEPDYSLIYCDNNRNSVSPLRFDFLNIPGMAQAQKPNGTNVLLNAAIFKTKGWFEVTNTALIYFTQFEYENLKSTSKADSPLILLGGYIDQFVSTQSDQVKGNTIFIHVGSNVLINSFGLGTHSDGSKSTPHVPVSVTGGEFLKFYLTGTYNQNADIRDDNAECYISGGRFNELAGAAQEQIGKNNSASNGNIRWQIYDADITDFYGGGINDAKPVQGNITTDIFNSHVGTFCGGPKFGNMAPNRTVTTTADGCTFDNFFGAGFGGNSYSRKKYFDNTGPNWNSLQSNYTNDRGKYYDGATSGLGSGNPPQYGYKGPGVAVDFDYEFFVWTSGAVGGRFFVQFVSFSLAQCNNVESTLKKCTINENFYGGGSLGKVAGDVTSTLEDCTVKGNVFGAGYSATKPIINVRNGGFSQVPKFNEKSGMFEPGIPKDPTDLTATTEFEWTTHAFPSNGQNAIDENGATKYVWTDQILTNENLGSVSGDVKLTLQGSTVVGTEGVLTTGNVYGGGDASAVYNTNDNAAASTTITLKGNTLVRGNVYGGGNRGAVSGNATVNIIEDE